MNNRTEVFLSRDSAVKVEEYKNIFKRHVSKEIRIKDVRLMDYDRAKIKLTNNEFNEIKSFSELEKQYTFARKGDIVGYTEEGIAFKFNDEEMIVSPELYDSITYEV